MLFEMEQALAPDHLASKSPQIQSFGLCHRVCIWGKGPNYSHQSLLALKAMISQDWDAMFVDFFRKSSWNLSRPLEVKIEARGDHIK